MQFENRKKAGQLLAQKLLQYKNNNNMIVLGIPRGGIVVAKEIAVALHVPLSVYVSRKIAMRNNPELGVGAISELNTIYILDQMINYFHVSKNEFKEIIKREKQELKRRIKLYRKNSRLPKLQNKIILLVDDGLAMGVTAIASILSLKKRNPAKIIFTAPVCAHDNLEILKKETGVEVITLHEYYESTSIGHFYKNFQQVSDTTVQSLLKKKI